MGINSSASAVANIYIPLYWGQKLREHTGKVNQIYVKATSSTQIAKVKSEIKKVLPGATVTTSQDLAKQVSGSLSSASTLANRLGRWLAIAALIAAVAVASLLTLSTVSRRVREFGTLKAIGWRSRRVVGQVVGEALVQGIAGGIVGVGLGYGCTKLISHFAPSLQATVGSTGQSSSGGSGFRRRRRPGSGFPWPHPHRHRGPEGAHEPQPARPGHRLGHLCGSYSRWYRWLACLPPEPS